MFGLFKKKSTPIEVVDGLTKLANEAHHGIVGRLQSEKFILSEGVIDAGKLSNRRKLKESFQRIIDAKPDLQVAWNSYLQGLENEHRNPNSQWSTFDRAAYILFAAVTKINICAKVALNYPEDERIAATTLTLIAEAGQSLDMLLSTEKEPRSEPDLTPSYQLFSDLPNVKAYLDKNTGLAEW